MRITITGCSVDVSSKIVLSVLLSVVFSGCADLPRLGVNETIQTFVISPRQANAHAVSGDGPALVVSPPQAQPGYDTPRIAYTKRVHELEYYANSQWADLPTAMLGPVLVNALSASGRFRAVLGGPTSVSGDLRLDVEIVSLRQEFDVTPSRVRVSLRAQLIDLDTRKVKVIRTFERTQAATSDDPYGGVVAINKALEQILDELVIFCANPGT